MFSCAVPTSNCQDDIRIISTFRRFKPSADCGSFGFPLWPSCRCSLLEFFFVELFFCRICKSEMELPADAVFVNRPRGSHYALYRFADGSFHDLTRQSTLLKASSGLQKISSRGVGLHRRWHVKRGIKKEGCPHCFSEETNGTPKR